MSSFTHVAEYYDDLMEGVPYPMWITYLELLWTKLDVQPSTVLEVCCGTGTLSRRLARKGLQMTGVDISSHMIEIARKKAEDEDLNIHFSCQDASVFELPWQFDAAFSFFDSLNYLTNPLDCESAILQTAKHLRPGAPFIFDLNTAYAFEQKMFDQSEGRPNKKVRYNWIGSYDKATRICRVEMDFWTDEGDFHEVHIQRAHAPDEVVSWMKSAGYGQIAVYDAYSLDRPKAKSDRLHFVGVLGAS